MDANVLKKIHEEGFIFFPVQVTEDIKTGKYTKKPVVSWSKFQTEKPTTNEVEEWTEGGYNAIGLVTGAVNNITVIDIDSASAKEWAKKNLPKTPLMVKTISGGEHWYYLYNRNAKTTTKFKHHDIDVRSDGGFVVAPPSDGYKTIDVKMSEGLKNLPSLPDALFLNLDIEVMSRKEVLQTTIVNDRDRVRNISINDAIKVASEFGLEFDSSFHCLQDESLSVTTNGDNAYFNDFGSSGTGGDLVWLIHDYLPARHPVLAEKHKAVGRSLNEVISKVANSLSIELNEMKSVFYFSPIVERYISIKANGEAMFIKKSTLSQMYLSITKKEFKDDDKIELADISYEPKKPSEYFVADIKYLNQFHDRGLLDTVATAKGTHPYFDLLLFSLIEDEEMRVHFINWLAYFFQTLEKGITAFVFYGVQGSGKTCLMQVISKVFGKKNCTAIGNNELESAFNPWAENKLFINLNEVNMKSKSSAIANKVKALITDDELQINEKHMKLRQAVNHANYIITSNEKLPVLVEESDRRYNVIYTPNILNKQDWFADGVYEKILAEAEEIAKTLASYKTSKTDYNKIKTNKVKGELQKRSKSSDELFIDSLFKNLDEQFFIDCHLDIDQYLEGEAGSKYITSDKLKALYTEYIGTSVSGSAFQRLASHGMPESMPKKINGKSVRVRYVA